jgi:CRP-like cAMP-binding protein
MRSDPRFEPLLALFARATNLTEGQVALIESTFIPRTYRKGQFYQRAGEVTTHGAFVSHGVFRTYAVDADGNESIVQFSPEGAWIGDIQSATAGTPTPYFVQAIEPSDVLLIDLPSFNRMLETIPDHARAYRLGLQRGQDAMHRRIALQLHASAEERYADFVQHHPALARRVPQRMLASYLGMTPETLSRVRRNSKAR